MIEKTHSDYQVMVDYVFRFYRTVRGKQVRIQDVKLWSLESYRLANNVIHSEVSTPEQQEQARVYRNHALQLWAGADKLEKAGQTLTSFDP